MEIGNGNHMIGVRSDVSHAGRGTLLIPMITLFLILSLSSISTLTSGDDDDELDLIGHIEVTGDVRDIVFNGDHLYLACNDSGMLMVPLNAPHSTQSFNTSGLTFGVDVQGNYAYLADWNEGLKIIDISDKYKPELAGEFDTKGYAFKVTVQGNYAYVSDWDEGLAIIDVSDLSDPVEVGRFTNVDHASDCTVIGDVAYLVDWWGLRIIDIRDRTNPIALSSLETPGYSYGIDVVGDYAYIADDHRGLRVIRISDPLNPIEVGHYLGDDDTIHVQVNGDFAYLAQLDSGVVVVDISDPKDIEEVAAFSIQGETRRVCIGQSTVHTASGNSGIWSMDQYETPDKPYDPTLLFIIIFAIPVTVVLVHYRGVKKAGVETLSRTSVTSQAQKAASDSATDGNIMLLRENENLRGFIRMKIAVVNQSPSTVNNVSLRLLYDEKVFRLDRTEPAYSTKGDSVQIGNVGPNEKKTVAFYLDPAMCTISSIDAIMSYRDHVGTLRTLTMRPKEVNVVCPIFFTRETANTALLKNLITHELLHQDSKIYAIPDGIQPVEAFDLAKSVANGRSIQFVREFKKSDPLHVEAWYYGVTKVKGTRIVIRISTGHSRTAGTIELFAATSHNDVLVGLLAELGHDLAAKLKERGKPAVQITNVEIKDSIINRSSLLFGAEGQT